MTKILTPEELEKRRKITKKILIFGCLPIPILFLFIFLVVMFYKPETQNLQTSKTNNIQTSKTNIDSLVNLVKNCKDFEIKEIEYNKKDSAFRIAITNKDNVIKDRDYSTAYFNNQYHLDKIPEIEGIYLYKYKKGKSFKSEPLTFESARLAKITDKFDKEYFSSYIKTYKPLYEYLQQTLNDPKSLEFIKTENTGYKDGVFSIEGSFRAKNGFGALMINNVTCNIDIKGNISNVKISD